MKYRRFLTLAISITLLSALCACGKSTEIKTENRVTHSEFYYIEADYSAADEYLRANGYPESFIANTGNQTKTALKTAGAVYTASASREDAYNESTYSDRWNGFSYSITVSDASDKEDNVSKKYLTLNWAWNAERSSPNDIAIIEHDPLFAVSLSETILEISGTGQLQESVIPPDSQAASLPETQTGTFVLLQGENISVSTAPESGVEVQIPQVGGCMLNKYFAPSPADSSMPYGTYLLNEDQYRGSFTIAVTCHDKSGDLSAAAACFKIPYEHGFLTSNDISCNFNLFLK